MLKAAADQDKDEVVGEVVVAKTGEGNINPTTALEQSHDVYLSFLLVRLIIRSTTGVMQLVDHRCLPVPPTN